MSVWYYERDGAQEGPVDAPTLRRLADEGVVRGDTLVWKDGMGDWAPAASVPGLMGGAPPAGEGILPPGPAYPSAGEAYGAGGAPHVDNHMAKAVLSTVFCCLPLGIVAIVFASQVNGKLQMGYYDDAVATAKKANQWATYAIVGGLAVSVLYLLFMFGVGSLGAFGL